MIQKLKEWSGVIALVAIIVLLVMSVHSKNAVFGAVSTNCQSFTTCLSDLYVTTQFGGTGSIFADGTFGATGTTTMGTAGSTSYYFLGGRDFASVTVALNSATTSSPAIVRNPYFGTATSSINRIQVQTATGVLGANSYDIATTTNCTGGNASSTPALVYAHSVGTGALDSLMWTPLSSSTPSSSQVLSINSGAGGDGSNPFFLRPNECLVMRVATSSPSSFTFWTGTFSVDFSAP